MNTASPMQRPLPYNVDIEANVIASVMIDPAAFEAIPNLSPEHFYRDSHALLFGTLKEMWQTGRAIDLVTLTDTLERDDLLNKVGGFAYLSEMLVRLPTALHVQDYAKTVYQDGEIRKGIGASEKAVRRAYDTGSVIEFQQYLKTAADSVRPMADRDALDNDELGRRILAQLRHTHETGEAPLLPMSLAPLVEYMNGWERKRVTVLGSLSSVGKSSLAIEEGYFLAQQGYHVVDVSIEIDATARVSRYLSLIGTIDETQLIRGFLPHDVPRSPTTNKYPYRRNSQESVEQTVQTAAAKFATLPISIVARDFDGDSRFEPDFTLEGIINHVRKIHAKRPVDFLIVDHIHIIKYSKDRDAFKQSLEYGEMVFRLLELMESLDAHGLLLHQLDEKALNMKVPDASVFPGSQKIYHNTNNMVALYKPASHDKNVTDKDLRAFNLIKVRRGQTGIVQGIRFDGAISRFSVTPTDPPATNGTSALADRFGRSPHTAAASEDGLPGW